MRNARAQCVRGASAQPDSPPATVFEKLTDSQHYTGSHRNRFDESGRGRGLDGRRDPAMASTQADLSAFTRNERPSRSFDKHGPRLPQPASSSASSRRVRPQFVTRLTDTGGYTGTHKYRFDKTGKGKGLRGRDSIAKGSSHVDADGVADYYTHPVYQLDIVHDLSLITPSSVSVPGWRQSGKQQSATRRRVGPERPES